jgi:hypothetical protein
MIKAEGDGDTGKGAGDVPSARVVSSVRVESAGTHERVSVWNRGGLAGVLVVEAGDGATIAAALERDVLVRIDVLEAQVRSLQLANAAGVSALRAGGDGKVKVQLPDGAGDALERSTARLAAVTDHQRDAAAFRRRHFACAMMHDEQGVPRIVKHAHACEHPAESIGPAPMSLGSLVPGAR